tara:strand:- start:1028 stop:1549 length:522 start_codon:yes stop_codon:yes gene_type:complete
MRPFIIILILVCLVAWRCSCVKSEKFTELLGFAGYKKPVSKVDINYTSSVYDISEFQETTDGVTKDEINSCLESAEKFITNQTKLCVYPIETNKIMKYVRPDGATLLRCRFMYMVTNQNFPFGFGASVDILNGSVVAFNTQPEMVSSIKPSEKLVGSAFLPIADIMPKPNMSL